MNAAGMILRNNFTSNVIRFGSLNEFREGGHNISFDIDTVILTEKNGTMHTFDPDRDGTFNPPTQAVPEPSSSALLLLGAGLGLARRKRRV